MHLRNKDQNTALIGAAGKGHTKVMKVLMRNDVDVNATGAGGTTALIEAARLGHADAVMLLVVSGADINATQRDGWVR